MTENTSQSPRWGENAKLLAGLITIGILAFLIQRFASLIAPLLLIFIIVYLLHPINSAISRAFHVSWKVAVNILFLVIVLILLGLATWGGVGLVTQIQNLIKSVQDIIANLPVWVADLSTRSFQIGPFALDMRNFDLNLNTLSQELLSFVQPLLGQTGTLVGTIAGGAAQIFGWLFFVLLVSYFFMIESNGLRRDLFKIDIPGYSADIERLGKELSYIWNAFLRGQIIIFLLALSIYSVLLPILGVRYALGIALMAGLAKFLPYIGPWVTWITMALVTYFQPYKPFDLNPLLYSGIVVGLTLTIDQSIDTFVAPRIMARSLKVHPAAVLVAALIAANLLGILGVVIAAPFLATFTLFGRYTMRKMFDMDPWPEPEPEPQPSFISELLTRVRQLIPVNFRKSEQKSQVNSKEKTNE